MMAALRRLPQTPRLLSEWPCVLKDAAQVAAKGLCISRRCMLSFLLWIGTRFWGMCGVRVVAGGLGGWAAGACNVLVGLCSRVEHPACQHFKTFSLM